MAGLRLHDQYVLWAGTKTTFPPTRQQGSASLKDSCKPGIVQVSNGPGFCSKRQADHSLTTSDVDCWLHFPATTKEHMENPCTRLEMSASSCAFLNKDNLYVAVLEIEGPFCGCHLNSSPSALCPYQGSEVLEAPFEALANTI